MSSRVDRGGLPLSTSSDAAAALYREGVDLGLSGWPGAEAAFDQALALDPDFALALAARARTHLIAADYAAARKMIGEAEAAVLAAVRLQGATWRPVVATEATEPSAHRARPALALVTPVGPAARAAPLTTRACGAVTAPGTTCTAAAAAHRPRPTRLVFRELALALVALA